MVAFTNRDTPSDGRQKAFNGRTTAVLAVPARETRTVLDTSRIAGSSVKTPLRSLARDSQVDAVQSRQAEPEDEIATPVKAFLSSNITPRSSSRKARADSASNTPISTPSGTPSSSRPSSMINAGEKKVDNKQMLAGTGSRGLNTAHISWPLHRLSNGSEKHTISVNGSLPHTAVESLKPVTSEKLPKFFHASDIGTSFPSPRGMNFTTVSKKLQTSTSTNGDDVAANDSGSESTSPLEEPQPKFFYANGIPEAENPCIKSGSRAASVSSNPLSNVSRPQRTQVQHKRATSPLKDAKPSRKASISKPSPRAYIPLSHNGIQKPEPLSPDGCSTAPLSIGRRSSLKVVTLPQPRHSKANSVSSLGSTTNRRSSVAISEIQALATPSHSNSALEATAPPLEHFQKCQSTIEVPTAIIPSAVPLPQSPEFSAQDSKSSIRAQPIENKVEQLNALAANARRERKVLDLEISNSSLLAINRTLEREMRKQTAELRRYRRLTSAGLISIAPSNRSTSSRISSLTSNSMGSDSEEDTIDEDVKPTFSSDEDESSVPTTPLSPTSQAARTAQQRKKDEKRLQLDLTRHQQLLIDSQRMNQSLKRCLGWTEDLITEGKKALAYRVVVGDMGAGGRVLTPDEINMELTRGSGLLSPSLEKSEYSREGVAVGDGDERKEARLALGGVSEAYFSFGDV